MSELIKLRRGTFQHVESELYAYHDTRKEIVRLKNEILYGKGSVDENVGGGRGSLPSDPTGRTAVLLTSHKKLEQLENIAQAIEKIVSRLPEDKLGLIQRRYWARPQTLTWDGLAMELNISRRTAINWRDEIVCAVAIEAGWR